MIKDKNFNIGRYDFLSLTKYLVPISLIIGVLGLVAIMANGFEYGIDFAGGTEIQVQFSTDPGVDKISETVKRSGYDKFSVQQFANSPEYLVRLDSVKGASSDEDANQKLNTMLKTVTTALQSDLKDMNPDIRRVDTVGPQVGDELKRNSLLAIVYSLIVILIYIGLRFDYKYAPSAVFCLFHDVIVVLGIFALTKHEVNLQTLAAVLTLIGYSLNDTIIVFDRIRENEALYPEQSLTNVVNKSVNDTLSRTILTSMTTLVACVLLYVVADGTIRDIGFTMGIGIVLGTFSSIYIASPIMILFDRYEKRKATSSRVRMAKA